MSRVQRSLLLRYGVPLVTVVLALFLKQMLLDTLEVGAPFLLFFTAVMISGWYGGLGPGLLATALSALAADYFFLTPGTIAIANPGQGVRLGIFVLEGALISTLTAARKWAEERARAQREWLQTTLSSIGDAVIVTDTEGRVTLINRVAQALTGWPQEQALTKPIGQIFRIVNEHSRQPLESPVEHVIRGGQIVGLANHTILIAKDGSEIPIDDSGAPIKDDAGKTSGAVLVFRDITASRQAEREQVRLAEEIASERERLNTLIASVPGIVWEAWGEPDTATQRIDFVSDYVETLLGYSVREWLERPNFWLTIVHPDDQERAARTAAEIFAGGKSGSNQFRWIAKDGRVVWVEAQSTVVCDATGRPAGMRGVALDITDIKRAEVERDQLLEREQAARAEAEAAQDGLAFLAAASALLTDSLDYEATLTSVAQLAVPRLADWCAVDLLEEDGTLRRLALEHADPAKIARALELQRRYPSGPDAPHGVYHVLRTGQPELLAEITGEVLEQIAHDAEHLALLRELGLKSALVVPLRARERILGAISLVSAESGRHYGVADMALARDLARRAATAVDNARLYQAARDALRARDQFLSIASHELKTPLTSLMGFAELLQRRARREGHLKERDQRSLQVIIDQANRLNRLVVALLDLSRIQTGQLSIERGVVDLGALVRRQVESLQPMLDRHTVTLDDSSTPLMLIGDELRLEQVVQNLLQNAIKYSPNGGAIRVRLARRDESACVEVIDQGIGIPSAALSQLFGRFYRAPNADAQQIGGMGIGLFVVREIVALHGGTVHVDSQEGQGSTFTVCLPLMTGDRMAAAGDRQLVDAHISEKGGV